MSGIFFPARLPLKIDGGGCSPQVLSQKIIATAHTSSYATGAKLLDQLADIPISSRGLNKTATKIGAEMIVERDTQTEQYFGQPLPRKMTQPETPVPLACVSLDGGRMQTREEGGGPGVHNPHWRETKNALFMRMTRVAFDVDPHPSLPGCFSEKNSMKSLLSGVSGPKKSPEKAAPKASDKAGEKEAGRGRDSAPLPDSWRPERLFRTCLSSLENSDAFGRMMQVEADSRGFYQAQKKAFVCDGLPYNWTIQRRHFREFTPILDFVHVVEKLYEAARCVGEESESVWNDYVRWASDCWQGDVDRVLEQLRERQARIGLPPTDCEKTDPRKILADVIGYLHNNKSRMRYAEYRQQGLPTMSAHMESLVKEIGYRVKGTEQFWDDGVSGEAILQIRAAALCDDDRLTKFLTNRPGNPFHPNARTAPAATAT